MKTYNKPYGNIKEFIEYLKRGYTLLAYDIETFTYNFKEGNIKPSLLKSVMYSFTIGFILDEETYYIIFNNFQNFFEWSKPYLKKSKPYVLNAHNGNRYDNHFIRYELVKYYGCKVVNEYLKNAIENDNTETFSILEDGNLLEKRVKSKNNLELKFKLDGVKFKTEDNWVKTNTSIAVIGKKLLDKDLITEEFLKTDYDYIKYNLDDDLTDDELEDYIREIFINLTEDEKIYIRNDVIILILGIKYYSDLFFGFSYKEPTFTSNIKHSYINDNEKAEFQLLKQNKGRELFAFGDYKFKDLNCFDYFNNYYNGGLNFYNDNKIGKILENGFSLDINSSYPYVMFKEKFPMYPISYSEKMKKIKLSFKNDEITFLTMLIDEFNDLISMIPSKIIKQIYVKYYRILNGEVYLNTNSIRLLNDLFNLNIDSLFVSSYVTFKCAEFGAKDIIDKYYYIKTQGKAKYKLDYKNATDISLTEIKNDVVFTSDEIAGSKVNLNGIYGVPALRLFFDLFRIDEQGEYYNINSGFRNKERNVLFSATVTSYAMYNLLSPLKYISKDIDKWFWYCDTDSLYLDKKAFKYLPKELYHKMNLGKWDIENENIDKFYILNHKKYCYQVDNKIKIHAGGVRLNSFVLDVPFEKFIEKQFSDGVQIKSTKSILNQFMTISIYDSFIDLKQGGQYPLYHTTEKEKILDDVKSNLSMGLLDEQDLMYIETELGIISARDLIPKQDENGQHFEELMDKMIDYGQDFI
nr:MAG TPA: DNA polymerase B [Caudoviricetes sp.]